MVLAQDEAGRLQHNYIGTEHLLLGLLSESEGLAARALGTFGISLEAARQQVEDIIGRGKQPQSGHIPFTPRAKKVLELSLREALQLGHDYIGPEHILLGVIREGDGVAPQVLVRLGADLNMVRDQVIRLAGSPALEETGRAGRRFPRELRYRGAGFGDLLHRLDEISARLEAIERRLGITPPPAEAEPATQEQPAAGGRNAPGGTGTGGAEAAPADQPGEP